MHGLSVAKYSEDEKQVYKLDKEDERKMLIEGKLDELWEVRDGAKVSLWLNGAHCLDYTFTNAEHLSGSIFAFASSFASWTPAW